MYAHAVLWKDDDFDDVVLKKCTVRANEIIYEFMLMLSKYSNIDFEPMFSTLMILLSTRNVSFI